MLREYLDPPDTCPTEEATASMTPAGWLLGFRLLAERGLVLRLMSGEREIKGYAVPLGEWKFGPSRATHPFVRITFDEPLSSPVTGWRVTPADSGLVVLLASFSTPFPAERSGDWIEVGIIVSPPKG